MQQLLISLLTILLIYGRNAAKRMTENNSNSSRTEVHVCESDFFNRFYGWPAGYSR